MSNYDIVSAFCDAWASRDIDAIMDFFAEDAVYHNIPMDPANVGKEQIRAVIEMFMKDPEQVTFAVHHQAESAEGVVLNERTDTFKLGDHTHPAAGQRTERRTAFHPSSASGRHPSWYPRCRS